MPPPLPVRIVSRTPALQRLMGRLVGMGARPEHVAAVISGSSAPG
jgi:hypothetical protein